MTQPKALQNVCEIYGQTAVELPSGQWVVTLPNEPTEYPALVLAFNAQLRSDWAERGVNDVEVMVAGTIPEVVSGRYDELHWTATLTSVRPERRQLAAYYTLERGGARPRR